MRKQKTLREHLDTYLRIKARTISKSSHTYYYWAINRFEEFLGRPATVEDLTSETIDKWLNSPLGINKNTIVLLKKVMKYLWQWLHERGHCKTHPTFGVIGNNELRTEKFTEEQVQLMISVASEMPGNIKGRPIPVNKYMVAWVRVQYDTGAQFSRMFKLKWRDFRKEDGIIVVNGKEREIQPDTVAAVTALQSARNNYRPGGFIFPKPIADERFHHYPDCHEREFARKNWKMLMRRCGFGYKDKQNCTQKLARSSPIHRTKNRGSQRAGQDDRTLHRNHLANQNESRHQHTHPSSAQECQQHSSDDQG